MGTVGWGLGGGLRVKKLKKNNVLFCIFFCMYKISQNSWGASSGVA